MASIGVDILGGDYAPQVVLEGCKDALSRLSEDTRLILFGPAEIIEEYFNLNGDQSRESIQVVDAPEAIGMHEPPVKALQQKPRSIRR